MIRLDSSDGRPGWSLDSERWPALAALSCDAGTLESRLADPMGRVVRTWRDPLAALRWLASFEATDAGDTRWAGYLSYDLGRLFERLPSRAADDLRAPLFRFTLHAGAAGESRPVHESKHAPTSPASERPHIDYGSPGETLRGGNPASVARPNFSRRDYERAVARCIDYIRAGDIFQVNLSQRFSADLIAAPAEVYARLLVNSPAVYGALLDYGDLALICNSPELFLQVTPNADGSRTVETRPIKGTRPRRPGMDAELRDSVKDQAELNMIVDLERNDLGRVCEIGSVRVSRPRAIEAHPTVFHGVATIEGRLRAGVDFVDLLAATFPGGSVTGAPKIRAMEIIDELEPARRGAYCGAIGYVAADGSAQFNVAIRTMTAAGGRVHVPVGGGIVADSDPAAEYEETLVKARAMFAALRAEAAGS